LLPAKAFAGAVIVPLDFDKDGDLDLFAPGRVIPGEYPTSPQSRLLVNDGKGKFEDGTDRIAPVFNTLGMITDARWIDLNGDKNEELVVVGEWSPVRVFQFSQMQFNEVTQQFFTVPYHGWWNTMRFEDLDSDGDQDLVVGNWGMNTQLRPEPGIPITLHYGDFDGNGFIDPLLFYSILGKSYPVMRSLIRWLAFVSVFLPMIPMPMHSWIKFWIVHKSNLGKNFLQIFCILFGTRIPPRA
jgi:hypothetical protein